MSKKEFKFSFIAKPTCFPNIYELFSLGEEYHRKIIAETKEDAIKKLKENFYHYDLTQIYLIDLKTVN